MAASPDELQEMIPIPITEVVSISSMPVDLYVRFGDGRFVQVVKAGVANPMDQIKNYQSKDVQYLWIQKNEYPKLAHQTIAFAGIIVANKTTKLHQKTTFLKNAAGTVFSQLEHMGVNATAYNQAKQITDATLSLVENHGDLLDLFSSFTQSNDEIVAHSLAVSALSILIAQKLGWEKRLTLEKLGLGALLHDIGLKAVPPELSKKPLAKMTAEELQIYQTHPYKGMQMLQSLGVVPDDVVSIVYEHHENAIGQGFPQRLRDIKMHPLARVVSLADQFVELTIPNPNSPLSKNPREALVYMEYTMGQPFNKEAFRALSRLILKEAA